MLRYYWAWGLLLIGTLGAIQVTTVRDETATWDEPVYLAAGYSYWTTGSYTMNPEHPPLAKLLCALPLRLFYHLRLDTEGSWWKANDFVMVGNFFVYRNTASPDEILFAGRLVTIALTLAFAGYVAWWTRRRFDAVAGLFAVALFVFDPNLIAHGRYATNDLAVALFVFTTCTLWLEYLLDLRWRWALLTGLSLGLALSSKYSALFLPLVLLVMAAGWVWRYGGVRGIARVAGGLALASVLSVAVVAIVYWPEVRHPGFLPPLAERISREGATGPLLSFIADRLHAPGYSFLTGIDWQSRHNAIGHPTYLLGQLSNLGWWYYFPIAFGVKTTVATLAALALALVLVWKSERRLLVLAVLLPAVVYFGVSMLSHINLGIRYLLPVYGFLYVAIAGVLAEGRRLRVVATCMVLCAAEESIAIYPYYLAFFNVAAGGPGRGPQILLDSNIDWGQDFRRLGRYLERQRIPKICLAYFANVDLPHYGVVHENIPENANAGDMDCVTVVSATPLFGQYVGRERFAWLRSRHPMAIVGHSLYVYDLRKSP